MKTSNSTPPEADKMQLTGDAPPAETKPADVQPEPPTVEHWRDVKKTPAFLFAGAKVGNHWPVGKELSEQDYDAAIDAVTKIKIS